MPPRRKPKRSPLQATVRKAPGQNVWELVPPRCALERADDLAEARRMIDAGEFEVAVNELRWLLEGCPDFIEAHHLLGELALAEDDFPLARGHLGHAYRSGLAALPDDGQPLPLPYERPANQAFLESGKGLAWCLYKLSKPSMALEVVQRLLECDPTDPLNVSPWLTEWKETDEK